MQKHQAKVEVHRKRVHTMSKGLMVLGCCGLAFAAYRFMMQSSSAKPHYGAKSHKLGASSEEGALDDGTT